jgi:hemoglobin
MRARLLASLALVLASCAAPAPKTPVIAPNDGEVLVPDGYRGWHTFLTNVQRPDVKQVRDIYVNGKGASAKQGDPFPNGTTFVMELYNARADADGKLATDSDGKLVKGDLAKIFVMSKGKNWGAGVTPAELRNGDWVYAAYLPDAKTHAPDAAAGCRGCHLPQEAKDFVHRYDEYFAGR